MIPRLKELRAQGHITCGEGEHKYPIKKSTKYEHCDIWWQQDDGEHWLEVKTIILTKSAPLGSTKDIIRDLGKMGSLVCPFRYHHMGIVFPVHDSALRQWKGDLADTYTGNGLAFEGEWKHPLWETESLYITLFGCTREVKNGP